MSINIDLSVLFSYLRSTSNLALSCAGFNRLVKLNGFPIRTSKAELCLETYDFYKLLNYPILDNWTFNTFRRIIRTDEPDQLLLLLNKGVNIEASDYDGTTALNFAAWSGKIECLKILLEHGADIEAQSNEDGFTPLIEAAFGGNSDCLKLLLEYKANIEAKDCEEDTALVCITIVDDKMDCLQVLLENKANIEAINNYGYTALMMAAQRGNTDYLKLLLQHKANIEAETPYYGKTALLIAAENGRYHCLKLLLESGAKVDPRLREEYPQYADLWGDSTL